MEQMADTIQGRWLAHQGSSSGITSQKGGISAFALGTRACLPGTEYTKSWKPGIHVASKVEFDTRDQEFAD
jgi:hypothetical protein